MNDMVKNLFLWLILAIILMSVFSNFGPQNAATTHVEYTKFLDKMVDNQVQSILIDRDERKVTGVYKDGSRLSHICRLMIKS